MAGKDRRALLFPLIVGLAAAVIWTGLLGVSTAHAQQLEAAQLQAQSDHDFSGFEFLTTVVFTDPSAVPISDLSGEIIGEGTQRGQVSCNRSKCFHRIDVVLTQSEVVAAPYGIEYRFSDRQSLDVEAERLVVEGNGTAGSQGQKVKFRFTATFQNNFDGTVTATYVSSLSDYSFVITSPGTFQLGNGASASQATCAQNRPHAPPPGA